MRIALLIGFEYDGDKDNKTLPGISVDLYSSYLCVSTMKMDKIIVYTDLVKDYSVKHFKESIINGTIDSGIISFIEDIKLLNQYRQYKSSIVNGFNKNNLEKTISELMDDKVSEVFIYFTGHAKDDHMILPNNNRIPLNYFRDLIVNKTLKSSSTIFIMDCCNGTGLGLPFTYYPDKRIKNSIMNGDITGVYKLNRNVKDFKFYNMNRRIICLSSSKYDQNALISRNGSVFSLTLFDLISRWNKDDDDITRYLPEILYKINVKCSIRDENVQNVQNVQTATLHSSNPNILVLDPWINSNYGTDSIYYKSIKIFEPDLNLAIIRILKTAK